MLFLTFSFIVIVYCLIKKFLVLGAGDAALAHLGIVMDVGVGETASFYEENLYPQQQDCQSHNSQSQ